MVTALSFEFRAVHLIAPLGRLTLQLKLITLPFAVKFLKKMYLCLGEQGFL